MRHKANSLNPLSITRPPQIDTSEWLPKLLSKNHFGRIMLDDRIQKWLLQIITVIFYAQIISRIIRRFVPERNPFGNYFSDHFRKALEELLQKSPLEITSRNCAYDEKTGVMLPNMFRGPVYFEWPKNNFTAFSLLASLKGSVFAQDGLANDFRQTF